jgi:hypothetical protein
MDRTKVIAITGITYSQSMPYTVLGDDMDVYYTKFAVEATDEIDLYYEMVCKSLGDLLGIPIPEACLIEYEPEWFVKDYPLLDQSLLGFGSKEISPNNILAAKTDFIKTKHDFNRIPNPRDLVKIGIFDLQFKNMDRNDANFNLIQDLGEEDTSKIFAIDHVQCFGGAAHKQTLHPAIEDSVGANILRTDYGAAICKYLGRVALNEILEEYFDTFNEEMSSFAEVIHDSPDEWGISAETKQRIENFVLNQARNESVYEQINNFFTHFS